MCCRHQVLIGEMNNIENKNVETVEARERITDLYKDGAVDNIAPGPSVPEEEIQDEISNTER